MKRVARDTSQKRAIRQALRTADRPLSPGEILEAAQSVVPGLGVATVYRTVKSLRDEGVLQQVDLPGDAPRYEWFDKAHHHHFHCRSCQRVYEVDACPGDLRHLAPAGFALESHEVILYGRCASCAVRPETVRSRPGRARKAGR